MRRGERRLGYIQGDYGKRRPVLVVETDKLNDTHISVLSCLLSIDLQVAPDDRNGLMEASKVMVDKVFAFKRAVPPRLPIGSCVATRPITSSRLTLPTTLMTRCLIANTTTIAVLLA